MDQFDYLGNSHFGLVVNFDPADGLTIVTSDVQGCTYVQVIAIDVTGSGFLLTGPVNCRVNPVLVNTVGSSSRPCAAMYFQTTDAGGTPINAPNASLGLSLSFNLGQVPSTSGSTVSSIVSSDVITISKVSHVRCTAMSMLVTNLAPPIEAGGELVMARTRQGILAEGDVLSLMSAIKNLPEEIYWRSSGIVDGGYSWYLPDQVESYEPRPISVVPPSDNVLIAAGSMSTPQGYVRVICTWTFEFYTPIQLFERKNNLFWSEYHKSEFQMLLGKRACSANAGHLALMGAISAASAALYNFYKEHEEVLDKAVVNVVKGIFGNDKSKPAVRKAEPPAKSKPLPRGLPPKGKASKKKK